MQNIISFISFYMTQIISAERRIFSRCRHHLLLIFLQTHYFPPKLPCQLVLLIGEVKRCEICHRYVGSDAAKLSSVISACLQYIVLNGLPRGVMRVVILGSGVVGVASAWYLAQAGHEVTVVDRQPGRRRKPAPPTPGRSRRVTRRHGRRRACR